MPHLRSYQEKIYTTVSGEEARSHSIDGHTNSDSYIQELRNSHSYKQIFTKIIAFGYLPVLLLWTAALAYWTFFVLGSGCFSRSTISLYSPIPSDIIQYERTVFNQGLYGERTVYMGGSKEANDSWAELVAHGIIKLDLSQASKLHDKTVPFFEQGREDGYVVAIEMWHQLHCMNLMRQALWSQTPQNLNEEDPKSWQVKHMDHCIDIIRQTIMCHGDTGIIPFSLDTEYHPLFNASKVCRKYEVLRDWADEHQAGSSTPEGAYNTHSHKEHLTGVDLD